MNDLEQMLLIGNFHEIHFHPKDCEITEFLLYADEEDIHIATVEVNRKDKLFFITDKDHNKQYMSDTNKYEEIFNKVYSTLRSNY